MTASIATVAYLLPLWLGTDLHAVAQNVTPKLSRYPGIRTQFNQNLSQVLTNEQRLEIFRRTVVQGRFSGRPMLTRMFGGFEPGLFTLSPAMPGLSTTVRLLASDNRNVVKGNARTIRYAMLLEADSRFRVVGMNRPRVNSIGATDADIVFRHRTTNLPARMEVKDVSIASQRANIGKLQRQILKMAVDARTTGEIQIWANHQTVLPEFRTFAQRHGVLVTGSLQTGNAKLRSDENHFREFSKELDKTFQSRAKLNALTGSVKLGMGVYMAYQSLENLGSDLSAFSDTQGDWLRAGEHGSTLLAGSGFSIAGAAEFARHVPAWTGSRRLMSLTRWGGRLGTAGAVVAEGFILGRYMHGDLTERQFWREQASLSGGLIGGTAGGFVGFKAGALTGGAVGSVFGPGGIAIGAGIGGIVGTIGGGLGGGYVGSLASGRGVDAIFRFQDSEQQERYAQFLLSHYQAQR